MRYVNTTTGSLAGLSDIRKAAGNVSLPRVMADDYLRPLGFAVLYEDAFPEADPRRYVIKANAPQDVDGVWRVTWSVTEKPVSDLRAAKKAEVTALRYTLETGGCDINGVPVDTSRESQSLITGAAFAASMDPAYTVRWKGADGVFRSFDAATITALATAVRSHVQACFDAEAAHHATLDALDDAASIAAYDYRADHADAPWPVAVPSEAV